MNAIGTNDQHRSDAAAVGKHERGARFAALDRDQLSAEVNAAVWYQGSKRRVKTGAVDHQIRRAIALFERFPHDQHVGDVSRVPLTAVKCCWDEAKAAQVLG